MTHLPDGSNDKLRTALTHDDALDDVKRARIWANLDARLDAPVSPRRWRWPVAFAVAASAAAVLGIVARHGSDGDVRTLVAPAEATLDAPLGPHTHARLVGPARLEVLGVAAEATTVRLSTGTLYAQFDGGAGRSLRIVTATATIDIVGTVFAVEVRDDETCISVAHGRVRATSSRGEWFVATGEHRCSRDAAVSPIDPHVKDALARHEAVIAATARPSDAVATISNVPPRTSDVTTPITPPASNNPASPPPSNVAASPPTSNLAVAPPASNVAASPPPSTVAVSSIAPPSSSHATASLAPPPSSNHATTSPASKQSSNHATTPIAPASNGGTTSAVPPSSNGPTSPPSTNAAVTSPAPGHVDASPSSRSSGATPGGATGPVSRAGTPSIAPPAPSEPPPPPPAPTAADLYRTAEAALGRRDLVGADRALAKLVTDMPASPLVDQALYERARIAFSRRAWGDARRHLDALAALGASSLTEPGRYLACRVAVEAHDSSARRCLTDYRASYPKSPHDADARAMLSRLPQDPP